MTKIVFTCKDPLIAEYWEREFGAHLNRILIAEAERQEWYDYTTDAEGHRHPIFEDGKSRLLIPEVHIG